MTLEEHPITPPPELAQQWMTEFYGTPIAPGEASTYLANRTAQWAADQELEACCEWLKLEGHEHEHEALRAARRPKPPSLKEQALDELHISFDRGYLKKEAADIIRRALESLPS